MEFIRANIWEIKKSGSLRTLGGLLAIFHLLLFYVWLDDGRLPLKLVEQGIPMCWSLLENCEWLRAIPFGLLSFLFYSYAVFAALAMLCFFVSGLASLGYYLLLMATGFGLILYFQDLRISSNEGYFIFFLSFAYLLVPSKHRLMRWMIVSFFAARGLSQASPDWLTGSWYSEHLSLPIKLAEWLAALSVLVQMIGGVALLFRDGRFFWTSWICLFVFECTHLYIGEFLPSCLSIGALLYVALDELELRKAEREYIYQSFIRPDPSFILGGTLLAIFWAAQLSPFLSLDRNSTVKNVLSVWTLHPEAAHEECDQRTFAVYKDRTEEVEVDTESTRQPAMMCNAYLRFLDVKAMCKRLSEKSPDFVTLSSVLQVRNLREKSAYRAFEVKDFCNPDLTFKRLGEVKWTTSLAK
jgi:hypothetical protein